MPLRWTKRKILQWLRLIHENALFFQRSSRFFPLSRQLLRLSLSSLSGCIAWTMPPGRARHYNPHSVYELVKVLEVAEDVSLEHNKILFVKKITDLACSTRSDSSVLRCNCVRLYVCVCGFVCIMLKSQRIFGGLKIEMNSHFWSKEEKLLPFLLFLIHVNGVVSDMRVFMALNASIKVRSLYGLGYIPCVHCMHYDCCFLRLLCVQP